MILGFSHLTLRCTELNAAIHELESLGYKNDFTQTNLQNPQGKRPFSKHWCDSMNMALMRSNAGGLPIELVEYPWPPSQIPFFFEPILSIEKPTSQLKKTSSELTPIFENVFGFKVTGEMTSAQFQLPFLTTHVPGKIGVVGLIQKVDNLENALKFWKECLNFKTELIKSEEFSYGLIDLQSPLKSWSLKIAVLEDKNLDPSTVKMDEGGITCLSFVSSSIDRDRIPFIKSLSLPTTNPFNIEINNKPLNLEIFDTGLGLFVELMEVRNPNK